MPGTKMEIMMIVSEEVHVVSLACVIGPTTCAKQGKFMKIEEPVFEEQWPDTRGEGSLTRVKNLIFAFFSSSENCITGYARGGWAVCIPCVESKLCSCESIISRRVAFHKIYSPFSSFHSIKCKWAPRNFLARIWEYFFLSTLLAPARGSLLSHHL